MTRVSRFGRLGHFAFVVWLALAITIMLAPLARAATPGELESCFLDRINAARAADGAPTLVASPTLAQYGRDHSSAMATADDLFHSDPAQLEPQLPPGWSAWGENVGYATGSDGCDWLFEGFWESPNHRSNLLNPIFDTAGIGVIVDAGNTIWTTHVFVQTGQAPPSTTTTTTSPPPPPVTTTTSTTSTKTATTPTAAASTSTTTQASSTTTTTLTVAASAPTTTEGDRAPRAAALSLAPPDLPATQVAGIESPCTSGCSAGGRYALFLALVGTSGLALSWWAFRG